MIIIILQAVMPICMSITFMYEHTLIFTLYRVATKSRTNVIVVTFIQIQSSLQVLQMLDMFAVCSYARANTKFKVPVDTIQ